MNKRHVQLLPRYQVGTVPGFGWLREAPRPANLPPAAKLSPTEMAKHAALRKCIYFPAMDSAMRPAVARAAERVRTNPDLFRPPLRRRNTPPKSLLETPTVTTRERAARRWASLEDPISVGILLAVVPPVGFMMLWGSPRYSRDAKLAITALMTVFMVLGTASLCTALLVLR